MEREHLIKQEAQTTISLREFLTVLFKYKYKILITFLATVITVTVGSFLLPPTYEAKSTVMVKFGREYTYRPEVGDTGSMISFQSITQEEAINSEIQVLTSRDLIEKVITTLGLENMYPDLVADPSPKISPLKAASRLLKKMYRDLVGAPPQKISPLEKAILQFEKKLSTEGVRKSNVIEVSYQHKDPQIAAAAVNRLVEFFKEKHLQVFSDPKSSFLEDQLTTSREKLKESENRLQSFKQSYKVFNLDEQRSLLLKQRTDLDTSLNTAQNRIRELQQKISSMKGQMRTVSENVPLYTETERYKIIDDAKAKLLALQLREQELLGKYKENSRLVVNIRKEIQLVRDFLEEQEENLRGKVRTGKNVVYQEMEMELMKTEAELSSVEAKSVAIEHQLNQLDRQIQMLDLREKQLRDLKREMAANEKNYQTYLAKVEEARISDEMNRKKMANISVIQPAKVPAKPIKPRKMLNILLGVFLGAFGSLGLAFFSEYAAQGLSTPEITERRLGLPVLGTVSYKK